MSRIKIIRWVVINTLIIGGLLIGSYQGNQTIGMLATIPLWVYAIAGTLVLGLVVLMTILYNTGIIKLKIVPSDSMPDEATKDKARRNRIWFMPFEKMQKLSAWGKPQKLDMVLDTFKVSLLIYLGYLWLPILYTLYILGDWGRRFFIKQLLNGYIINIKNNEA